MARSVSDNQNPQDQPTRRFELELGGVRYVATVAGPLAGPPVVCGRPMVEVHPA